MRKIQEQFTEAQQGRPMDLKVRSKGIVRTSAVAIGANVLLSALKALIGMMTRSIAITLDAVNNLTDAASSVITIAGTALAAKKPDKKHPYGHGRIEYLSAMLLGAIVMSAGISSLAEAVQRILHAEETEYTVWPLVIVGLCVLVKLVLGRYVTGQGKRLHSEPLVDSGKDAAMDALVSASTLAAALLRIFFGVSVEGWLGAAISLLIVKTGAQMEFETLSELLGQRVDAGLCRTIRKTVETFPEVHGVYDLMLHDYGPDRMTASLHIEVDDRMPAWKISDLTRRISMEVLEKDHVLLTAVGIYSMDTEDENAMRLRGEITDIAMGYDHVLQVHGFSLRDREIRFDVIVDFDAEDPDALCAQIVARIREKHPELTVRAFWDADYSFSE